MKIIETDINWGFRAHDMGRHSVKDLAEKISAKGFHNIQLALQKAVSGIDASSGSLSPGMGHIICGEFMKRDIRISVMGCYINPVHPDREIRKNHLNRFIEHLRYCRDFGCSVVGTETGSVKGYSDEETFSVFISSLRIMVEAAEKTGTLVAIEGVADKDSIHSHEKMKRVFDLIPSPNLGIIYDPVNFLPFQQVRDSDRLMEEAFELFGDKMVAVHAKDYILETDRINKTVPSGKGDLNYPLLLDLIRQYKPMIPVLVENNTPQTIDETINFINRISR